MHCAIRKGCIRGIAKCVAGRGPRLKHATVCLTPPNLNSAFALTANSPRRVAVTKERCNLNQTTCMNAALPFGTVPWAGHVKPSGTSCGSIATPHSSFIHLNLVLLHGSQRQATCGICNAHNCGRNGRHGGGCKEVSFAPSEDVHSQRSYVANR
jgi:hypothetical protein